MHTTIEILEKSRRFLEEKGVESARLDSEQILASALNCKRLDLYLQYDRPLNEAQLAAIRPLLRRRARREPLQYILGTVEFFEISLAVDRRALIPRPETEQLVEGILAKIKSPPQRILDLGTGCGAIAIALAARYPRASLTAVDQSDKALGLARENIAASGLEDRIEALQSDWYGAIEGAYDLIVSNPPYLSEEEWRTAQPEVRAFEPRTALVAPKGGLADLEKILRGAPPYLKPNGVVALETGIAHHEALALLGGRLPYQGWESQDDLLGNTRFFYAWR